MKTIVCVKEQIRITLAQTVKGPTFYYKPINVWKVEDREEMEKAVGE